MPYADPERQKEAVRAWNEKLRNQMREIIRNAKNVPCMDCGRSYPYYVMQFDHVRGEKIISIAKLIRTVNRKAIDLLNQEIQKCDIVCANCHALRHGGLGTSARRV